MSAGYHLDVFDFTGNEALAEEARERARALNFTPPVISAGLDLILNFARRREVGRAEALIAEVRESAEKATAWHGWLWGLRLAEALAETALARGDWDATLEWASRAIEQCRRTGRVKYEALGLTTRAQALVVLGRTAAALADLERALGIARRMGDPALFLRTASILLAARESEAIALEARSAAERIATAISDDAVLGSFRSAEQVRTVLRAR
jgi:tetratricopeptide (TPR) repeat protein